LETSEAECGGESRDGPQGEGRENEEEPEQDRRLRLRREHPDPSGCEDDAFGMAEDRATLSTLMGVLTERERRIVRLRFEQDLTQEEIGEIIGLSQMQISRILRTSIERLRTVARHGEALQLAA